MRIPTHIQRSRHGIYFFRMVVPKALRETSDGQTEIKRLLHTRNLREAMRMARPLSLQAYELFAHLEAGVSRSEPSVADILANDKAGRLRELRAIKTITLPDGTKHSYDIQTDSNDPAEIAAFERQVERERADLREAEARYREKPVELPQGMQDFQQKQSVEMAEFKATLYPSELKMPSCWAVWETGLRRCKSSPYQRIGLRFAPCPPIPQTTHQPSIFSSEGYRSPRAVI